MITPLYALPLTVMTIALSANVVRYRKSHRVSLGDGGQAELQNRIRAHGNLSEYAPLGIVLLLLAELAHAAPLALHLCGIALVLGRVLHAWALAAGGTMAARAAGMVLTYLALLLSALVAVLPGLF